jgi:hypothetical protein
VVVRHASLNLVECSIAALSGLLAIMALAQLGWMLVVMVQPGETMYGEAIVYDHAARVLRGEPLYQPLDRPPYTVAAYTPLFYWFAAALRVVVGAGFGPGRILSFVAGCTVAILVGHLVARRTRDYKAGMFAALLFFALGLATHIPWSALYKEDALGVLLGVGSVALLASGTARWRLVGSGVLAGLAVLTKQPLFAAALAGTIWLWARSRKEAVIFAAISGAVVLGTCATLEITTRGFVANAVLANLNPVTWDALRDNLGLLAHYQLGPMVAAVAYVVGKVRRHKPVQDDLLIVYWLASLLPLVGLAKVGSNYNYWLEPAATTAALATLAVWSSLRAPASHPRSLAASLPVLLLAAQVGVLAPGFERPPIWQVRAFLQNRSAGWPEFSQLVERVHNQPGEVLADSLGVVVLADRPIAFEPYLFSILYREGKWDPTALIHRVCAGEVTLLVTNVPLDTRGDEWDGYPLWAPPLRTALLQVMTLEQEQAGRYVYIPRGQCAPERDG